MKIYKFKKKTKWIDLTEDCTQLQKNQLTKL